MKDTYVDGKKLARNGRKMITYYAASFLSHYRRVLFSYLLVFNLCNSLFFFTKSLEIDPWVKKSKMMLRAWMWLNQYGWHVTNLQGKCFTLRN